MASNSHSCPKTLNHPDIFVRQIYSVSLNLLFLGSFRFVICFDIFWAGPASAQSRDLGVFFPKLQQLQTLQLMHCGQMTEKVFSKNIMFYCLSKCLVFRKNNLTIKDYKKSFRTLYRDWISSYHFHVIQSQCSSLF